MIANGQTEPLTPAEFEAISTMRLEIRYTAYAGIFATDTEQELYAEAVKHHDARGRLVAEVEWLSAALADLRPGPDGELTMWRALNGPLVLGTYTDRATAQEHCLTDAQLRVAGRLSWFENSSDPDVWDLWAEPEAGEPSATGYLVAPLAVQTRFDPERDS